MKESKITVRPTPEEYEVIRKRAEAANMSVNRYLIESALRPMPRNDRKLSVLMGQLCRLENAVQETGDLDALQKKVKNWRKVTIEIMGAADMALMKFITENALNSPYDEKYKDDDALWDVIGYVCNPEKTGGCVGGWAVDPNHAAYEMELLAKLFHNDQGVRLRHWTIAFAEYELCGLERRHHCDCITALYRLGAQLSAYYKDQYQILYAVHGGEHPHLHFVMNTVSYVDGKKFSGSKADYYQYEKYAKNIAHRFGLTLYTVKDHAATKYYHSY